MCKDRGLIDLLSKGKLGDGYCVRHLVKKTPLGEVRKLQRCFLCLCGLLVVVKRSGRGTKTKFQLEQLDEFDHVKLDDRNT